MRRVGWAAVILIAASALGLTACDDDSIAAPARDRHPPTLAMVRSDTLPPPPFRGDATLIADRDRLLALAPIDYLDFRAKRMAAEFDFQAWRWRPMPGYRGVRPAPVTHGLVSLDTKCTVEPCNEGEGEVGFVFVETRADDATRWTTHRLGDQPRDLDSSYIGGPPIGHIGDTAYWGHGEVVRASLSGEYRVLIRVRAPSGLVCMVGHRMVMLEAQYSDVAKSGRVFTLDLDADPLNWHEVPASSIGEAAPGGGVWLTACSPSGPIFATRTRLYRFSGNQWTSAPMATPPDAPRTLDALVTSTGDIVYSDNTNVYRLHRGSWTTSPIAPPPLVLAPLSGGRFVVVGDIPVAAVFNPETGVSSVRVAR